MRRFLFLATPVAASLLLTACEPTVDDYTKNAKLREEKLRQCAEMGVMAAKDDEHCKMAMEAQSIVIRKAAGELVDSLTLQQSQDDE